MFLIITNGKTTFTITIYNTKPTTKVPHQHHHNKNLHNHPYFNHHLKKNYNYKIQAQAIILRHAVMVERANKQLKFLIFARWE